MTMTRPTGVRIPLRERADLARRAFELSERGIKSFEVGLQLGVSQPTAINLIGYGRRLAAGEPEQLTWR